MVIKDGQVMDTNYDPEGGESDPSPRCLPRRVRRTAGNGEARPHADRAGLKAGTTYSTEGRHYVRY
jgi:hypothetical protein